MLRDCAAQRWNELLPETNPEPLTSLSSVYSHLE